MKKTVTIILAALLATLSLTLCACKNKNKEEETGPKIIIDDSIENDDLGEVTGTYNDEYELGGVPLE